LGFHLQKHREIAACPYVEEQRCRNLMLVTDMVSTYSEIYKFSVIKIYHRSISSVG
jgi:hypothetical protein